MACSTPCPPSLPPFLLLPITVAFHASPPSFPLSTSSHLLSLPPCLDVPHQQRSNGRLNVLQDARCLCGKPKKGGLGRRGVRRRRGRGSEGGRGKRGGPVDGHGEGEVGVCRWWACAAEEEGERRRGRGRMKGGGYEGGDQEKQDEACCYCCCCGGPCPCSCRHGPYAWGIKGVTLAVYLAFCFGISRVHVSLCSSLCCSSLFLLSSFRAAHALHVRTPNTHITHTCA